MAPFSASSTAQNISSPQQNSDSQSSTDGIAMQMNSPLPFAYAHLVVAMVHTAVLLSVVKCGIQTALADHDLAFVYSNL